MKQEHPRPDFMNQKTPNGNPVLDFLIFAILAVILAVMLSTSRASGSPSDSAQWKEPDWSRMLAERMNGEAEHRLPDGSRVDILTESTAWEVEWTDNWPEAIGQALFYAISTDREPGVVLLWRGTNAEEDYLECLAVVARLRGQIPFRLRSVKTD